MTLYAGTIPPEMLKLAMDTRKALDVARGHIENHNYGLADDWIVEAIDKLPEDIGEQIIWLELERRTSA